MGPEEEHQARATARERALAAGFVALVVALGLLGSVHPWYDPTNDGSMYIATARSLAAGEGYSYLGAPFLIRPPGFSCLIAPVIALCGTSFFALNLTVSLFGAAGIVLFHMLLRERLGLVLGSLVPLVLWFNPGYQRLCNQVMSDVPGWTCLLVCLLLGRRLRRAPSWRLAALVGVSIGLATLVRSGNLLLVPALGAAWVARIWRTPAPARDARAGLARGAALCGGVALVLLPWALRNRAVAPPPPADQTLLYSYSSGMWHEDMGDPRSPRVPVGEVLARFPKQGAKALHTLATRLQEGEAGSGAMAFAWILLAALGLALLRRSSEEEGLCWATLLVVAFYFGYAGRLLLPVFAFGLVALLELVRDAGGRLLGRRVGTGLSALLALAWIAADWHPRAGWSEIQKQHEAYLATARDVRAHLPAEARLGAYRGWHHAVFLDRPVYGFEQTLEREGRAEAAEDVIEKYSLDHVLLTPLGLPPSVQQAERAFAAYVARRYGGGTTGLVRVRP